MDPLSVIASITGVLAVAAKITTALAAFIEKNRDAPKSIRRVVIELSDLRVCLDQLVPFIRGIRNAEKTRKDAISVEQVVVISTSLVLNIAELDKMLDSFNLDQPMSTIARLRWTKNEEKVDEILTHVRASKSSLNLILTIFTCASTQAAQTLIWNLTSTVEQILQTSEDVSRRVANIETRFATSNRYPNSTLRASPSNDDASTIIPFVQDNWDRDTFAYSIRQNGNREVPPPGVVDIASTGTSKAQTSSGEQQSSSSVARQVVRFDQTLESELYASRVYSRNTHRHSISSLFSTENSATGLSFLSGISLAQISNLSVISLPIFSHELWNPQQYRMPQNSGRSASLIAEFPSLLKKSRDYTSSVKGSSEIPADSIIGLIKNGNLLKGLLKSPSKAKPTAESIRSAQIDHMLKSEKIMLERAIKILLLGAGHSGKSTVQKRIKLLYEIGFTLEERKECRQIIFSNIVVAFEIIFQERKERGIDYESDNSLHHEQILHEGYGFEYSFLEMDDHFPPTFLASMKALYADEGFQRVVRRGNEFALHDNFQYYLKNVDRLFSPQYLPNDQDVLHSRVRTTGFVENHLQLGKLDCLLIDVGGARSERKKWVHLFESVHCVIFTAPLSGYDECLVEDQTANQMKEGLILFDSLMTLEWFKQSTVIILLTKLDLFRDKLSRALVSDYFPDYIGAQDDSEAAQRFFVDKFLTIGRERERNLRVHCTNVMDTDSFRSIVKDIEASIRDDQ